MFSFFKHKSKKSKTDTRQTTGISIRVEEPESASCHQQQGPTVQETTANLNIGENRSNDLGESLQPAERASEEAKVSAEDTSVNLPACQVQDIRMIREGVFLRKIQHLDEIKDPDDQPESLGGPEDLQQCLDIQQEVPHISRQDVTSQFQGAHHFTISGNPHFENIGVKKEYHYDHGGTYGMTILREFVSFKALHDSYAQDPIRMVHPGTRQYVLKRIRDWIDTPGAKESIFWLHGPAGIGKSAIAQTIAQSSAREKLPATFFFYRSDSGRNNGNRLFTTLAWQFAFSIPATKEALIHSLKERPDIPMKNLETQFEELIVKPFLTLKTAGVQLSAPVVIIDGVDECSDDGLQRRFLKTIGNAVREGHVPLRFLICSRPEAHIQEAIDIFRSFTLSLDLATLDDANKDIEKYLKIEFSRIATEQDLNPAWPGQRIIQEFVCKASGHFIYASTVIKRVGDEHSSAETQLDMIRGLKPCSTVSLFAELDELYMEILRQQRDPVFLKDFLSLLIGRSGIDVDNLHEDDDTLMNVSKKELHRKLRGMLSLLKLEPYIQVHHRSFLEFLQDPSRSGQYHISKQAGTRRYLDFIAGSLVRYASTAIERHDDHNTHFSPRFHCLTSIYPAKIVLLVGEWQEALQPLLYLWNKLLTLPNFRYTWELLPCKKCTGVHTMRDLFLHLAFHLEGSDPDPNSAELHAEGSMAASLRTVTKFDMKALKDLDACFSSLLPRLRRRKLGISLDTGTIQLTRSLLRFDHTETAMKLQSISDAQNLVDLIDELINSKYSFSKYSPDIPGKAVHLALEIYARVPVLPRSLFSNGTVGSRYHDWTIFRHETELLFQTAFMCKILDPNYIVRVSTIYEEDDRIHFVDNNVNESNESLSQWRQSSKPSSATRIRVMLELAKAIRYFHSMGIVLHIESDYIFLDSESHATKLRFLGLTEHYVKVSPRHEFSHRWLSYEANVSIFGSLFYEMCSETDGKFRSYNDVRRDHHWGPDISNEEKRLIQSCRSKDPKTRPTIDDIVREMESWDTRVP